jgi:S-adenosylmethionine:tRNA ribosyltransferase-isomerase
VEPVIRIEDYNYNLPDGRIAKYPLEYRDSSKLLIYNNGNLSESVFRNIYEYLPSDSLMIFNNTRVVPARLFFRKETGAVIEIFCLEPVLPNDYALSFACNAECSWNVVIGNAKKWKSGDVYFMCDGTHQDAAKLNLRAELVSKGDNNGSVVKFKWDGGCSFSEVLDICGRIPIPPYLKRDTEELDYDRYQTLYAKIKGSVAAPTAGLHFTDSVFEYIDGKNIHRDNVCLHVGAGTFVPVKSEFISDHVMHTEPIEVSKQLLVNILDSIDKVRKIIAVGTTSTRSLESLYFAGVHCIESGVPGDVLQWEPYSKEYNYSAKEAIAALVEYMDANSLDKLVIRTGIIIVPSYKFRIVDILVTNFHQPQSTLLLLISAFVGGEWQKIYNYALNNDFRFLSYGDSSLLFCSSKA